VALAHFQMTQCGSRRFLHMLVTMAILAFKLIRNPLIYAVFVYRSDRFLLHCILRHTYRSNLDNCFVFIVVFAFRIGPFYVLPKISLFGKIIFILTSWTLKLVSVYTSTSLFCSKSAAKHSSRRCQGTQIV